jgi:hypothetical protein
MIRRDEMEISDLVSNVNLLADEEYDFSEIVVFFNDAISKINIDCEATFPMIDKVSSENEYTAIPDKWQKTLFVPFALGRLKQLDSSQFEYVDAYTEFSNNLAQFRVMYIIPEEYKDESAYPFETDFSWSGGGW